MEVQNKSVLCTETPLSQNYGDARVAKHLKTLPHSILRVTSFQILRKILRYQMIIGKNASKSLLLLTSAAKTTLKDFSG